MTDGRRGGRMTSGRDPLTPEQRRLNMSRVRGKDTKPEMVVRRALHAAGLRYRLHGKDLPGRPDLIFPGRRTVIFVHGCFWHGHDCPMYKAPATNAPFWSGKIGRNRARDLAACDALRGRGWRVIKIWECAVRGRARWVPAELTSAVQACLDGQAAVAEFTGRWDLPG